MQSISQQRNPEMQTAVTRLQAFIGLLVSVGIIIGAVWSMSGNYTEKYTNHEERIKRLEDEKKDIIRYIEKVEGKVDDGNKEVTQIRILLESKANRK